MCPCEMGVGVGGSPNQRVAAGLGADHPASRQAADLSLWKISAGLLEENDELLGLESSLSDRSTGSPLPSGWAS